MRSGTMHTLPSYTAIFSESSRPLVPFPDAPMRVRSREKASGRHFPEKTGYPSPNLPTKTGLDKAWPIAAHPLFHVSLLEVQLRT